MPSGLPFDEREPFQSGQLFQCPRCGAEVKLIIPPRVKDPKQVLMCCGGDMVPVQSNPARLQSE